jgi:trehalose 6-phosphate synthase
LGDCPEPRSAENRGAVPPDIWKLAQAVGSVAGHINGKYGEVSWTPIRYVNRVYSRSVLAGLYRTARLGLVTPLRDGMNLVAKEYVAAQDPNDPGVLVLSRFAGAAVESSVRCSSIPMMPNRWPTP